MLFSPLEDSVLRILIPVQFKGDVSGQRLIDVCKLISPPARIVLAPERGIMLQVGELSEFDMVWDIAVLASESRGNFNGTLRNLNFISPLGKYSYVCLTNARFSGVRDGTTPDDCGLLFWNRINTFKLRMENYLRSS